MNLVRSGASTRVLFMLSAAALASGCGKSSTGPTEATLLVFKAGGNQSGTVGSALPVKIVVEARNDRGAVPNTSVAMSVESQGGGSISPAVASTGPDGTAQFTWTLGSKLGVQTLTASTTTPNRVTANITATASVGAPSVIVQVSDATQLVVVGRAVGSLPSVKVTDAFGNLIAGVAVSFQPVGPGAVVTGAQQTTDAGGVATVGGWTIGNDATSYTLQASIPGGAAVLFEARGIPASINAVAGTGQTANVGTALPVLPAVKAVRDDGSPLPNVTINFNVTGGGGAVTGTAVPTGLDGVARPIRWVLGITPGVNQLEASTLGRPPVTFVATGQPATPASVVASAGTALSGFFGNFLTGSPTVTVTDAQGNVVAGVTVSFQVTDGGGQVTGGAAQTDFAGRASVSSWRLGASGNQTVTATVAALPPIVFTANGTAPPASTFRIEIRYPSTQPTATQRAAFDAAVARWTQLIVAGAPPYTVVPTDTDPSGQCPSMTGQVVDGIVIYADLKSIDGVGNVLGATGVCIIRDQGFLPVQALMIFDSADLPALETNGTLGLVILHEMGHALGFGTIWNLSVPGLGTNAFLSGFPGGDPSFNGPAARAAFFGAVALGTTFTGTPVPVEGSFGPGTRYSHWRESTFGTELMTGFLGPGSINPLSAMTVQQFHDLGYVVNDASADSYTFQAAIMGAIGGSFQLVEGQIPGNIIVINRKGQVVGSHPRVYR